MANGAGTPSSSFLFVRQALIGVGGFDEKLKSGLDHDIWMSLAANEYSSEAVRRALVIVRRDSRQTMMSDAATRIRGIDQFVNKWLPTYQEWFGVTRGNRYATKYFIRVICRLAGEQLSRGAVRNACVSGWAVLMRAGRHPRLTPFAAYWLLRCCISSVIHSRYSLRPNLTESRRIASDR